MSKPEYLDSEISPDRALSISKPNPGAQLVNSQTFGDWVKRDREWKENGAISVPKYS
jgi:hypothetical protein